MIATSLHILRDDRGFTDVSVYELLLNRYRVSLRCAWMNPEVRRGPTRRRSSMRFGTSARIAAAVAFGGIHGDQQLARRHRGLDCVRQLERRPSDRGRR